MYSAVGLVAVMRQELISRDDWAPYTWRTIPDSGSPSPLQRANQADQIDVEATNVP